MTRAIHGNMCVYSFTQTDVLYVWGENVLMERKSRVFFLLLRSPIQQREISTLHICMHIYLVIIWGFTDGSDKWQLITSEKQFTCKPKGKRNCDLSQHWVCDGFWIAFEKLFWIKMCMQCVVVVDGGGGGRDDGDKNFDSRLFVIA